MNDARNCVWLTQYPHQAIAGGSMYAIQLPEIIPPAGQPGGPPLPTDYRYFGGMGEFDLISMVRNCIRDPQQLQPTMDRFEAALLKPSGKQ